MSTSRDQVHRLLALVPYLQASGAIPVAEAAELFGVPPRTIVADLHVLMYCGWPGLGMGDLIEVDLDALEGEGVIRLSNADYLTRPLRLQSTEAAALVVALRTLQEGSSPEERAVVERALAKIESAAGEGAEIAGHVQVHLPDDRDSARYRQLLVDAVTRRQRVRITHHSPQRDELTERTVDPITVLTAEGHHYLDGWCHRVEDRRLFRLDRITDLAVLDEQAAEHPELEPLDLAQGIFRPGAGAIVATLRLSPQARWVTEYYPTLSVEPLPDGALRVRLHVSDPGWLVSLMLRLGGNAEVEDPPEVADAVRAAARTALDGYA